MRFINNCRLPKTNFNYITQNERQEALKLLIKSAQLNSFQREIKQLQEQKSVDLRSSIIALAPFLDEDGLLRVGGRLRNSNLPYTQKHPILLPAKHLLTKLLFRQEHNNLLHIGALGLLNHLRELYWPIRGTQLARATVRSCIKCFKINPRNFQPLMGNLPSARITPAPPFLNCGVDFAGPFQLKSLAGRGGKLYKAYVAVFVCMAVKAVHLELVTELSTEAFLAALRRMISRRGHISHIFSDNATNFIGANRELKILVDLNKDPAMIKELDDMSVKWHFIPARSPHFGGIWEINVKAVKYHLSRIIGLQTYTFEAFYTTLTQIEAIINSRPITPLSSDPNDLKALTPAHFLIGRSLNALPDDEFSDKPLPACSRYKHAQQMAHHFWQRWHKDYLNTMQQRIKWRRQGNDSAIQVGRLAIIKEEDTKPLFWRLGRIIRVIVADDGIVRVVELKTTKGTLLRAVNKICPLPLEEEETSDKVSPSGNID